MALSSSTKRQITELKSTYDSLKSGKESLLALIDENEIPEAVYNSNAIENSTLTLKETERILLEMELSRNADLREVLEATNLARVTNYIRTRSMESEANNETILLLHQMLMGGIDEDIAGRFRKTGEYVKVGTHIAPAPEKVQELVTSLLGTYSQDRERYFLQAITQFHLDFETIHPFNDGNGRIGRVLINYQLQRMGFPGVIIRNKEKKYYYRSFKEYSEKKNIKLLSNILARALTEALHKRIAYLKSETIITLADYAKKNGANFRALLNMAKRQTLPAFRERGVWKIGDSYTLTQ